MKDETTRRGYLMIDLHVLVVGVMVSLLVLGFVSVVTWVPGSRTWLVALQCGVLPPIAFLAPMIVTRACDRRRFRDETRRYLIVNGVLMLVIGVACAVGAYLILPG